MKFCAPARIDQVMTPPPKLHKTLMLVWPLLMGVGMIMVGNGLQGTLLGLRAHLEGFPVFATGIVMSMYYVGFVIGCNLAPRAIASVGHIRVFAAVASLASTTILLHGVFINIYFWGAVRVISGISFAGMFIVAESWLNNIATNKRRGQIFSSYLFVIYAGLFSGQFLVNIAPLGRIDLFVLVSVLVSLSLMPLVLANKPAPGYEAPEHLPFKKLMKRSPLAMAGVFASGLCAGTVLGIGPVYANEIGFTTAQTSFFIASYILGCALIPLFIGWLSDHIDRRQIIIAVTFCGFILANLSEIIRPLYIFIFLFGGTTASIYSICIAYMNDKIKREQILSATASLILFNSMGACLGPVLMGLLLQETGTFYFFPMLSAAFLFVCLLGTFRTFMGKDVDVEDQTPFIPIPTRSSPEVLTIAEGE